MNDVKMFKNLQYAKIFISVVAIIWVAFEYYGNIHQRKVDRAFAFAERYLGDSIVRSHVNYNSMLVSDEFLGTTKKFITGEIDSKKYYELIGNFIDRSKIDIFNISEFYTDVSKCLQEDRCDKPTICSFFGQRVDTFVFFYGDDVKDLEEILVLDPLYEPLRYLRDSCAQRVS